jgi:hypothetical protein
MAGALVLAACTYIEVLAGWTAQEILQSTVAATGILVLGMIRSTARKEKKDKLWITALWHALARLLDALITHIHVHEDQEEGSGGTRPGDEPRESPRTEAGPLHPAPSPTGGKGTPVPPDSDASVPEEPAIVERHGSWVRRESKLLYTKDEPFSTPPRRRDGGLPQNDEA